MEVVSPLMELPVTWICLAWSVRVMVWGVSSTKTSATEDRGMVPPIGVRIGMERAASRLFALALLP